MSRKALLLAVRDHLRDTVPNGGLALTPAECELAPLGGRPPARMGKQFVGVFAGPRVRAAQVAAGLDEKYECFVCVTMRISVPIDQLGTALMESASNAFDDLVDAVRVALHKDSLDNRVLRRANTLMGYDPLDANTARPFYETLEYLDDDGGRLVGGEWFWADDNDTLAGMACVLHFGRPQRTQSLWEGTVT